MASTQQTNEGYRGHRKGSRKEAIHRAFDRRGAAAALREGAKRKLKNTTLRSWFSGWRSLATARH